MRRARLAFHRIVLEGHTVDTDELADELYSATEIEVAPDTAPLVEQIRVRGLHGRFNYDLNLQASVENARLTLFYGNNGSGKTTILRLVWDLLSPAPTRGHRTRIGEVAFSEFTVLLSDNVTISATRKLASAGPFEIETRRKGRLVSRSHWPERHAYDDVFDEWPLHTFEARLEALDDDVAEVGRIALARRKYLSTLEKLGAAPYYLADDRSTSSDELEPRRATADARRIRAQRETTHSVSVAKGGLPDELERSIGLVNAKLRRLALGASVSGSAGANSVYVEVLRKLAGTATAPADPIESRRKLINQIRETGTRSRAFESLGLVPKFVSTEFIRAVESVPNPSLGVTSSILKPYLESLTARLDALEESQVLIQTVLDEANGFLSDKRLTYRGGFRIELEDGSALRANQLSSGECHVLLLLCNAVLARGNSRLFLIDEPELSLNVKWQRRIVRSLLAVTDGSGLQFILATHSIELLSNYRHRVEKLEAETRLAN